MSLNVFFDIFLKNVEISQTYLITFYLQILLSHFFVDHMEEKDITQKKITVGQKKKCSFCFVFFKMCFLFPGICMKPLQTNYIQDEETNEKKKFIKVLFYHHCCLTVDWTQCLTVLRNLCCSEKNVRHIFIMRSYRLLNYAVYGIKNIKSSSSKS